LNDHALPLVARTSHTRSPRSARCAVAALAGLLLAALLVLPGTAAAALPRDPLAVGPYGATPNRVQYNAGTLQLTTTSMGYSCTGSTCGVSAPPTLQYGQSTRGPGNTYPQPLQGSVTWPTGTAPANGWKVLLFLHGRHNPCKTSSGSDGTSQTWASGVCTYGAWDSWNGYDYISNLLASWGYVVISPDASSVTTYDGVGGVIDAGAVARAQIIASTLDALYAWNTGAGPAGVDSNLVGKLDFSKVGIMGHSRGGEGVSQFINFNRQRPEPGRRYNLQAVFSLAPIDTNKQAPQGTNFATLLPACDGDVSSLSGANAFERGLRANPDDPFDKFQYYVEGTNHNYYNSRWASDDRTGSDAACGSTPSTRIRLSRAEQQNTGLVTIATFLRVFVGDETDLLPWLTGDIPLPASASPDYTTPGTTTRAVPYADLIKTSYIARAGERLDVIRPDSANRPTTANPVSPDSAGGTYKGTGFSTFEWCNPDPFADPALVNPPATQTTASIVACPGALLGSTTANSFNRSFGPQLALAWNGPATVSATLRGTARDVSPYREVSFRAALQHTDVARNPLGNGYTPLGSTQDAYVALVDAAGQESVVKMSDYSRPIEGTLGTPTATTNPRHTILKGFRVPLTAFTGVDLTKLDRVELRFGINGLRTSGAIQLSDLVFQEPAADSPITSAARTPATPQAPTTPLPGDPVLPKLDAVVTKAVPAAVAAACPTGATPTVKLRSVSLRSGLKAAGSATTAACGTAKGGTIERVQVTVSKKTGKTCSYLSNTGKLVTTATSCKAPLSVVAVGTRSWKLSTAKKLPKGTYTVKVKAISTADYASKAIVRTVTVR